MESINNDYILKLFNLDNRKISSIEVHHQFDGVHVHVLLAVEPYRCPVCGTETSKTHSYTHKKITHSILSGIPCFINYKARRYIDVYKRQVLNDDATYYMYPKKKD